MDEVGKVVHSRQPSVSVLGLLDGDVDCAACGSVRSRLGRSDNCHFDVSAEDLEPSLKFFDVPISTSSCFQTLVVISLSV